MYNANGSQMYLFENICKIDNIFINYWNGTLQWSVFPVQTHKLNMHVSHMCGERKVLT